MDINSNIKEEINSVEVEEEIKQEADIKKEITPSEPYELCCRSVRIGSYKVFPPSCSPHVPVFIYKNKLTFTAPILSDSEKSVCITLHTKDIQRLLVHFGRCLPIMFASTTTKFGELLREALHMIPEETPFFDPSSSDDTANKLTFLIQSISQEQVTRHLSNFAGKKATKIDQKQANEILVASSQKPAGPDLKD